MKSNAHHFCCGSTIHAYLSLRTDGNAAQNQSVALREKPVKGYSLLTDVMLKCRITNAYGLALLKSRADVGNVCFLFGEC
ncbi:hypothetical protein [Vibrio zhanjiangensis]|uniref:hypothetical protein n=1 Tax=Vibrio zhanjiangensis TaxID=1046128 RepID=UPI0024E09B33|nr:hypothetical protein [Vibrio zhanjiangensis]